MADWIIEAANQGLITECAAGRYCPTAVLTQGDAARVLVKTFYDL